MDRLDEVIVRGDGGRENSGELGEGDRHRCDRSSLDHEKQRPTEKETDRRPIGFAEKDVNSAGSRHHRGQLGTAKRAGHRHDPGHSPRED